MLKRNVIVGAGILASMLSVGAIAAPFNVQSANNNSRSLFMAKSSSNHVLGTFFCDCTTW